MVIQPLQLLHKIKRLPPSTAAQPVINAKVENHNESKAENNSNPIGEGFIDQATSDKSELKSEVKVPTVVQILVKDEDYFKRIQQF
ncbi:hypothetical protein O9993_09200 [Vibrio lentus]|nr:hypothetical protein [Vibrio lentus]